MSDEPDRAVADAELRSALEFAIGIAAAGAKLRPPLAFPGELRRFLRFTKLPATALAQVRAAVDGDEDFRKSLASVATSELVDDIGMLWLTRPDGWEEAIAALLPDTAIVDQEAAARREERRRKAAQAAAARARTEAIALTADLQRERAAKSSLAEERDRLRAEVDEVRRRLRDAQRNEHAAAQALAKAESQLAELRRAAPVVEPAALRPALDEAAVRARIAAAIAASSDVARFLTDALDELAVADEPVDAEPDAGRTGTIPRPRRRTAIKLPGGVLAGSIESTEFLLRAKGVRVLIDGYNVAKLGWPALELAEQRERCTLAVENLAKRWKIDATIVFDGAAVEGAHAPTRRRVRIAYSPPGVSADDVLRAEVAATPADVPVVVVTNDRAIVTDVVQAGANTITSDALLTLTRR